MTPQRVRLDKTTGSLELHYADGVVAQFSGEYLRVMSPSAEVRGHGPGEEVLQHGKKNVKIAHVEASGHYALHLHFDDGHDTGIYSWDYLRHLWDERETIWQDYLAKLHRAGQSRDPDVQVVRLMTPGEWRPN